MQRRRALAWGLASGLVSAGNVGLCVAGRALNDVYAEETRWVVAQYRAPEVWLALLAVNVGAWCWLASHTRASGRRLAMHVGLMLALTIPLGLELGMGIHYQQLSGELRIHEFLLTRAAVDFQATPDGVCVRADLSDAWTWRLNEHRLHPKLLPLPLDDARLRSRLLRPGDCVR